MRPTAREERCEKGDQAWPEGKGCDGAENGQRKTNDQTDPESGPIFRRKRRTHGKLLSRCKGELFGKESADIIDEIISEKQWDYYIMGTES